MYLGSEIQGTSVKFPTKKNITCFNQVVRKKLMFFFSLSGKILNRPGSGFCPPPQIILHNLNVEKGQIKSSDRGEVETNTEISKHFFHYSYKAGVFWGW